MNASDEPTLDAQFVGAFGEPFKPALMISPFRRWRCDYRTRVT